jgi:predicted GNAT family N-acyltransferase
MKVNNQEIKIKVPESKEDLDKYYHLRYEILRKPWGKNEQDVKDDWEDQSIHLVALDSNGNAVGTARLQINSVDEGQIRSMAVKEDFRKSGLGSKLLKMLEEIAAGKKMKTIMLDSRDHAVGFYEKNGYKIIGESYVLFGVIPHFRMMKDLCIPTGKNL